MNTSRAGGTMAWKCPGRFQLNIRIEMLSRVRMTPAMAWKAPKLRDVQNDRDPYALEMLAAVLDGHDASRFSKNLVRGTKIAQSAGAGYDGSLRGEATFVLDGQPAEGRTIADLEGRMQQRTVKAGEAIFSIGDRDRHLYLIRRGVVRIMAPISGSRQLHHIATFGRGDFFGGLAFLDDRARSDNAIARTDIDLFVLSLDQFNQLAKEHRRLAFLLITAISRTLAHRLRHADGERTLLHV